MLAVAKQSPRATEYLRKALLAHPAVRRAYAEPTRSGLRIWVFVDEPYMKHHWEIIGLIDDTEMAFRDVYIEHLVLRTSEQEGVHIGREAEVLVDR